MKKLYTHILNRKNKGFQFVTQTFILFITIYYFIFICVHSIFYLYIYLYIQHIVYTVPIYSIILYNNNVISSITNAARMYLQDQSIHFRICHMIIRLWSPSYPLRSWSSIIPNIMQPILTI